MDRLQGDTTVQKLIAYSQTDGIPLRDLNSEIQQSELLMLFFSKPTEGYEGLRQLCQLSGRLQQAKLNQPVIAGWCSWYYYYTKITEQEMIANLEFFKQHRDLPIELIQLDDGYQTAISDWGIDEPYTFNEKFPHGLSWLVEQIHAAKFKAGLWVAPFFTTSKSQFYQQHPDWVLRDKKQKPVKTTYNWGAFQYALDLSQDEVVQHVERLAHTITQKWMFDFLKIDFIFASEALSGKYKNPCFTRAQILRRGVEAIRRGLGSERYLLGCGAPLGPCVGLVDAMRISNDTAAVWEMLSVVGKLANVAVPALKPALKSIIQRSYMHNTYCMPTPIL